MIVRQLQEAQQTSRRIVSPDGNWESTRMLLKDDNMGYSFHITTIYAGADFRMHYQNHLESVYCISGEGEVETLDDGKVYKLPRVLYTTWINMIVISCVRLKSFIWPVCSIHH